MLFPVYVPPPMPLIAVANYVGDLARMLDARTQDAIGWTPRDYDYFLDGCEAGRIPPQLLAEVIGAESEFVCNQPNRMGSGAEGLTQLMGDTRRNLGWRPGAAEYDQAGGDFCRASVHVQLMYAFRYFAEWRRRFGLARWDTRAQLYLANFLPAEIPYAADGTYLLAGQGKRMAVLRQNPGLDLNGDGKILVEEADAFVRKAAEGRARRPLQTALTGIDAARRRRKVPLEEPSEPSGLPTLRDVADVRGVQRALAAHGFDPGPPDGIMGPRTRQALRAFQFARGLRADGWVGPYTLAALSARPGGDQAA